MSRTTFTSRNSFAEARLKATMAGYIPDGEARNPRTGEFIVFGKQRTGWI